MIKSFEFCDSSVTEVQLSWTALVGDPTRSKGLIRVKEQNFASRILEPMDVRTGMSKARSRHYIDTAAVRVENLNLRLYSLHIY